MRYLRRGKLQPRRRPRHELHAVPSWEIRVLKRFLGMHELLRRVRDHLGRQDRVHGVHGRLLHQHDRVYRVPWMCGRLLCLGHGQHGLLDLPEGGLQLLGCVRMRVVRGWDLQLHRCFDLVQRMLRREVLDERGAGVHELLRRPARVGGGLSSLYLMRSWQIRERRGKGRLFELPRRPVQFHYWSNGMRCLRCRAVSGPRGDNILQDL